MAYTTIDDPSAYFQTKLYTGTGSELVLTNDGNSDMQPDFVWIKQRNIGQYHNIYDSNRGATTMLYPDLINAEYSAGESLKSFNTDGFTVGNYGTVGTSSGTYAAWQWKANGGTTTSVSASGTGSGCVNACTHQANTTAGFSIITYTGRDDQLSNGQESKLTHGLGVAPSVFICKRRDGNSNWYYLGGKMVTTNNGWNNVHLLLNQSAAGDGNSYTSNTEPDSTYIYLGNQLVNTVDSWVGYAFAEKQGYSKFGSYKGNSHSGGDGPFIYTGFAPAWVMIKRTDAANDWVVHTYKLGTISGTGSEKGNIGNENTAALRANENSAVDSWGSIDMLSNGFKPRSDAASENASGTYIYMAFAENPFVTSTGIPTTAR
tara:strand:- start:466 stop:1587 length:1122 start_codon:yes stop_codon:yes gene_type:complete